jgi:hypothetical protein
MNRNTKESVEMFLETLKINISRMPDRIETRGGKLIDGPLWKSAANRAVDELTSISHLASKNGLDWFENEFNERIVIFYNESVDLKNASEK